MTKTDVFGWAELTDDVKRRVLEANVERSAEHLSEDVHDVFASDLSERGLDELIPYWSLGHSQGDGVSFTGSINAADITDEKFLPILAMLGANKDHALVGDQNVEWSRPITKLAIKITSEDNFYSHAYTMGFECTVEYDDEGSDEEWDESVALDDHHPIYVAVKAYFISLAQEFERNGYAIFDDDMSWGDWYFESYGFDADGTIIERP